MKYTKILSALMISSMIFCSCQNDDDEDYENYSANRNETSSVISSSNGNTFKSTVSVNNNYLKYVDVKIEYEYEGRTETATLDDCEVINECETKDGIKYNTYSITKEIKARPLKIRVYTEAKAKIAETVASCTQKEDIYFTAIVQQGKTSSRSGNQTQADSEIRKIKGLDIQDSYNKQCKLLMGYDAVELVVAE